jgi:hypothetical protein
MGMRELPGVSEKDIESVLSELPYWKEWDICLILFYSSFPLRPLCTYDEQEIQRSIPWGDDWNL